MRWKNEGKKDPPGLRSQRKQLSSVIVILLSLAILILVGNFLYFRVLADRPEELISDALVSSLSEGFSDKPVEFTGEITSVNKTEQVQVTFRGVSEHGLLSARGNQHFFATIKYKKADYNTVIESEIFTTQDGSVYVKIDNLQEVVSNIADDAKLAYGKEGEATLSAVVEKYNKRWIKLSEVEIKTFGLEFLLRTNECASARQLIRLGQAEVESVKNMYASNPFVVVKEDLGSEKINQRRSHRYKLSINEASWHNFTKSSSELPLIKALSVCRQTPLAGLSGDELDSSVIELWVDAKNHKVSQLSIQNSNKDVTSTYKLTPSQDTPQTKISKPKDTLTFVDFQKDVESILGVPLQQISNQN